MIPMKYRVSSGNWVAEIVLDEEELSGDNHFEAATRAMEMVFGAKESDERNQIVSMLDVDGEDIFFENYQGSGQVTKSFTLLTSVIADQQKEKPFLIHFLTSAIFENAAQPANVDIAIRLESENADAVKRFRDRVESQNVPAPVTKSTTKKKSGKKS